MAIWDVKSGMNIGNFRKQVVGILGMLTHDFPFLFGEGTIVVATSAIRQT